MLDDDHELSPFELDALEHVRVGGADIPVAIQVLLTLSGKRMVRLRPSGWTVTDLGERALISR